MIIRNLKKQTKSKEKSKQSPTTNRNNEKLSEIKWNARTTMNDLLTKEYHRKTPDLSRLRTIV